MRKYVIGSHGQLSAAMKGTLEMLAGSGYEIQCFSMTESKSGEAGEQEIRQLMRDWQEHDYVVFTDLMGGSVNNIFTTLLLQGWQFQLVTGMNLALLLGTVMSPEEDARKAVVEAVAEAKNGILHMNQVLEQREVEEDDCLDAD